MTQSQGSSQSHASIVCIVALTGLCRRACLGSQGAQHKLHAVVEVYFWSQTGGDGRKLVLHTQGGTQLVCVDGSGVGG